MRVTALVLAGDDGCLGNRRVAVQGGLDLTGLDAEAPDLDLAVSASDVLEAAVPSTPCEVTGAVHAGAIAGEGISDEPARREG